MCDTSVTHEEKSLKIISALSMKDLVNMTLETTRGNEKRWLFREHTRIDENEWINDWKNERIPNEMPERAN